MDKFRAENPNSDPDIIETRADLALDNAQKYSDQHPDEQPQQRRELVRPRIVMYKNKCDWIGQSHGDPTVQLTRAVRFNHKIPNVKFKLFSGDAESELEKYSYKATQLTLPHRFGLAKTPTKDVPKTTPIELDDPPFNPSPRQMDSNHKVRGIFG